MKKYSGRCPLVHVKDFRRKADGVDLLALGEGEQDFPTLVKTAKECGAQWLVIEQDDHPYGTPMGDMKKSLNYLKIPPLKVTIGNSSNCVGLRPFDCL